MEGAEKSRAAKSTVSRQFGPSAGDLTLLSSDNVLFYYPYSILQYASRVFAARFEADDNLLVSGSQSRIPVKADSCTLASILTFAHPGLPNPHIESVTTLQKLLTLAQEYDMRGVRNVLKTLFLHIPTTQGTDQRSLIHREPLYSFIVAVSFDCIDEAQFALREVIKCDWWSELERVKAFSIPLPLLRIIMLARAERKSTLRLMADEIVRMPIIGLDAHEVTEEMEEYLLERSHNLMKYLYLQIESEPSFERLKVAICDTKFGALAEEVFRSRTILGKLFSRLEERKAEALAIENELPDLLELLSL
jgi:hypothetical protein